MEKEIMQCTTSGQRRRGRPRTRWQDNITKWTGLTGDRLLRSVEDRRQWRKIIHEAVNPRTAKGKASNVEYDSSNNCSLSRSTVVIDFVHYSLRYRQINSLLWLHEMTSKRHSNHRQYHIIQQIASTLYQRLENQATHKMTFKVDQGRWRQPSSIGHITSCQWSSSCQSAIVSIVLSCTVFQIFELFDVEEYHDLEFANLCTIAEIRP